LLERRGRAVPRGIAHWTPVFALEDTLKEIDESTPVITADQED
jgi:hypothetical protein